MIHPNGPVPRLLAGWLHRLSLGGNGGAGIISVKASHGLDYPDPMAAADDPAWAQRYPGDAERAVAAHDAMCKSQTGLVAVWTEVTGEYQTTAMQKNVTALKAQAAALSIQLANAQRIIATAGA